MARYERHSEDRITGESAPIGQITGFPKPFIKSAWPTPIGKKLTNRKIAMYAKKGYYVTNNAETRKEKATKSSLPKRLRDLTLEFA